MGLFHFLSEKHQGGKDWPRRSLEDPQKEVCVCVSESFICRPDFESSLPDGILVKRGKAELFYDELRQTCFPCFFSFEISW